MLGLLFTLVTIELKREMAEGENEGRAGPSWVRAWGAAEESLLEWESAQHSRDGRC